jgi:GH25 family lysozyme M1 (1,4-beta-N-acetylmuramidase)
MEECMATVPGIDVSHWDGVIDWAKVRATGQRFMFTKATEANTYQDDTFKANWLGAKSVGILRGAYHFFRCNVDAKKQADYFINYVRTMNDDGELAPALDFETNDGVSASQIIPAVKIWLDAVEAAFGKKPFIYTRANILQQFLALPGGAPPSWANNYPLWLAWYPNQYVDGMAPALPRGYFAWTIWQYSGDVAMINGINARVDLNLFNGTIDDLYKFTGASIPAAQRPSTYSVVAGDSFDSIANKFGVTLRELMLANPQLLTPGLALNTPPRDVVPPVPSGTSSGAKTYTIQAGDTLTSIAAKFGTTVGAIATANNITNINAVKVGLVLTIPS